MCSLTPIRSELQLRIMASLFQGEKRISDLVEDIGTRETTILHILKKFEALSLTSKSAGVYKLTSIGVMSARVWTNCIKSVEVIEEFKEFWLQHDVEAIPTTLILKIGDLKDSNLVQTDPSELNRVHAAFIQILKTSKRVRGISPIFHPDYVQVIEDLLSQGRIIELILTSTVLEKASTLAKANKLKEDIKTGKLKVFLNEDLKVALTVTDNNFSLGLFFLNGEYDYGRDLISNSPAAIEWGEELFQEKLKSSRRIGSKAIC